VLRYNLPLNFAMTMGSQGEEDTLFDEAMSDVKPLKHNLAAPRTIRSSQSPPAASSDETDSEFGEQLSYLRPGIQAGSLQKLRRGQFRIEAIVDLHGLSSAAASEKLRQFIQQSQLSGRQAVRVVHGKGYGSVGRQPILKAKVNQDLRQFPSVLAFCSAKERDGGTGAVDVLLRGLKNSRE
jgi:DNA-nicking Smr family endonuclease